MRVGAILRLSWCGLIACGVPVEAPVVVSDDGDVTQETSAPEPEPDVEPEPLPPGPPGDPARPLAGCRVFTWSESRLISGQVPRGEAADSEQAYDDRQRAIESTTRRDQRRTTTTWTWQDNALLAAETEVAPDPPGNEGAWTVDRSSYDGFGRVVDEASFEVVGGERILVRSAALLYDDRGREVSWEEDQGADGSVEAWRRTTWTDEDRPDGGSWERREIAYSEGTPPSRRDTERDALGRLLVQDTWDVTLERVVGRAAWTRDEDRVVQELGVPAEDGTLLRTSRVTEAYADGVLVSQTEEVGDEATGIALALRYRVTYVNDAQGRPLVEIHVDPQAALSPATTHRRYHGDWSLTEAEMLEVPPSTGDAVPTRFVHVGPDGRALADVSFGYLLSEPGPVLRSVVARRFVRDAWGRLLRTEVWATEEGAPPAVTVLSRLFYACP